MTEASQIQINNQDNINLSKKIIDFDSDSSEGYDEIWKARAYNLSPIEKKFSPYTQLRREELLGMSFLKSIRNEVVQKKFSLLASFDGRHRSGKSVTAVTFAYLWDETFWPNFEKRVVQDHKEFNDALDNIIRAKIKGAVIFVDEAGVSMGSTDWYETWAKTLAKTMQMVGIYLPIVLFASPLKDFVMSSLRKMMHMYLKVKRTENDFTTVTPYRLEFSTFKAKIIHKKPVIRFAGEEIILRRLIITKPPAFLLERYQNLEKMRKGKMFEQFMDDIQKNEEKQEKRTEENFDEVINKVIRDYRAFQAKTQKPNAPICLDLQAIQYRMNLPQAKAKFVKRSAEEKINEKLKIINENNESV